MATTKEQDIRLIEKVKNGDTQAFRQLVDEYKDLSLSLACSILKDRAQAEDAIQEAFIKVFRKADSFRQQSAFSSWLFRIVVNTSYNQLKRNRSNLPLTQITSNDPAPDEKSALQQLREADRRKYVIMALDRLKPDEALVLRLFYLCEHSLKEIAKITGFSTSKIKVDLHRGRKNMGEALKRMLGDQLTDLL